MVNIWIFWGLSNKMMSWNAKWNLCFSSLSYLFYFWESQWKVLVKERPLKNILHYHSQCGSVIFFLLPVQWVGNNSHLFIGERASARCLSASVIAAMRCSHGWQLSQISLHTPLFSRKVSRLGSLRCKRGDSVSEGTAECKPKICAALMSAPHVAVLCPVIGQVVPVVP